MDDGMFVFPMDNQDIRPFKKNALPEIRLSTPAGFGAEFVIVPPG